MWDDEKVAAVLDRIADGWSLTKACQAEGLKPSTFAGWVRDDLHGLYERYTRARDIGLDLRADRVPEAIDSEPDVARARLKMDAERWYLSKLDPKRYGDKVTTELTGSDGGPIKQDVSIKVQFVEPTHEDQ